MVGKNDFVLDGRNSKWTKIKVNQQYLFCPQILSRFHSGWIDDLYSSYNDADPRGLRVENLLGSLKQLNVNYFFGKINNSTDDMINEFRKVMKDDDFVREVDMANPGNIFSAAVHSVAMTIDTRIAATLSGG